jgi:hypothetical protein
MSRFDQIQSNSRAVLRSDSTGLSTVWQYRRLTSNPGVEPRTYTDWEDFDTLPTSGQHTESYDGDRATFTQSASQRIRSPDDEIVPPLEQGDQVKDPAEVVWAVMGVGTSGPGSIAWSITRDTSLMADGDRKGGV